MSVYERLELERIEARHARLRAERERHELAALRHAYASLRLDLALIKLRRALKLKYRPDQPRVPAGNPDGGQWTSEGGGEGTGGDNSIDVDTTGSVGRTRVAQNESQRRYSVDLGEEEARGGHTIREHVAKSDEELLTSVRADRGRAGIYSYARKRNGSFPSVKIANEIINETLQRNSERVDAVASGRVSEDFLTERFGYETGREAIRPDYPLEPYMRSTDGVGVLIRHDRRSPRGYRVHTAFPRND